MKSFDPVTLATPFFVVAVIAEIFAAKYLKTKSVYEPRDTATSLMMGLGTTVAALFTGGVFGVVTLWVYSHRLFTIPMTSVWAWVAIVFLDDVTYYWWHRVSHDCRLLWAAHVNHHSSQHYNLSTALRQPWSTLFTGGWMFWLPLAFFGFPPTMIAIEKGVSLVYQFWVHTEAIRRLPGPIEAVFNTPSHHRVHHARNPRYLDRNFAGILIIWDRMFGTFEPEAEEEPCRYGMVKNLGDFNILRVAFHEWVAMGRDLLRVRSARDFVGYVFGPPGWSPDGSRETSATLKRRWREQVAAETNPREAAVG